MRSLGGLVLALVLSACGSSNNPGSPDAPPAPDAAPPDATPAFPAFAVPAFQVTTAGGPVMTAPRLVSVTFSDTTDAAQMDQFISGIAASTWWQVLAEYGVGAVTSTSAIHLTETGPQTIDDTAIKTWLADKIANDPTDFGDPTNAFYVIFYPATSTTITVEGLTLCNQAGGYHAETALTGGGKAAYAVIPTCPNGFNGHTGVDSRSATTSHEIAEGMTDPYIATAPAYRESDAADQVWSRTYVGEIGDMCISQDTGTEADVTLADLPFLVQRVWSNAAAAAGHDPCQPTGTPSTPYFNAFPELPTMVTLKDADGLPLTNRGVQIAQGAQATIAVDLYSDAPTDVWSLSAISLAELKGLPASLQFTWDRSYGKNGDRVHVTIKVLSANTAQNGEIFWIRSTLQGTGPAVTHDWLGVVGS
jgi:hypothetical protein